MKRYISKALADIPIISEISVIIEINISQYVKSADMIDEGDLDDTQVLANWQTFILNTLQKVKSDPSLILLYEDDGKLSSKDNKTPLSKYYYVGVKDSTGKLSGKVIVNFRLSTHTSADLNARLAHDAEVLTIIQKNYPNYIKVKDKDLIINKKTFKDYDLAEIAVDGMLAKITNTFGQC